MTDMNPESFLSNFRGISITTSLIRLLVAILPSSAPLVAESGTGRREDSPEKMLLPAPLSYDKQHE